MYGLLVIDKPRGPTSHDVVAVARRALREKRIGHTGTLDPLATGVLPLLIGRATRLAQFLAADEKEYVADVRLGAATSTYDAETGGVTDNVAPVPSHVADAVAPLLGEFRGTYLQSPPPFSAKKIGGVPAHRIARKGAAPEMTPSEVTVTALEILSHDGALIRLRIVASSGFYVRSLAHDLGQRLGCGAHLEQLRRIRAGEFTIEQAVTLDTVVSTPAAAVEHLIPVERLLPGMPSVTLDGADATRAAHGAPVTLEKGGSHTSLQRSVAAPLSDDGDPAVGRKVRLFDDTGRLLGIAEAREPGVLHPVVVLV